MASAKLVFATYAGSSEELKNVFRLAESIRTFAGRLKDAPILLYVPDDITVRDESSIAELKSLGVEMGKVRTPEKAKWFYYSGKVYAAAAAEGTVEDTADVLVWLDEDTVVLDEPTDFALDSHTSFAYVPVMHNRSGTRLEDPPGEFWGRIYEKLAISDDMLFAMETPADRQIIRAYFHVGLIVVRPEHGILRRWAADFEELYNDPMLVKLCEADVTKRIFIHQTALMGVLHLISREEMRLLPARYNYPIFFEKQYGGVETFDSIENVCTVRCVVSEENMGKDWHAKLAGPADRIAWLRENF